MKTLLLALGFLFLCASVRADILIRNDSSTDYLVRISSAESDGSAVKVYAFVLVKSGTETRLPTRGHSRYIHEVFVSGGPAFSIVPDTVPISADSWFSIWRDGTLTSDHSESAELAMLWDWWLRGFGLGIGFCALGAFVRMIRAAKGATSLEL